jgi:hypothetical protein
MADSIMRIRNRSDYTILSNHAIKNANLSYKACGILWHLLSKPDGWTFNHNEVTAAHKEGRDAVRGGVDELKAEGYVKIEKVNDVDLKWEWTVYEVPCTDFPTSSRSTDFPTSEIPHTENPTYSNTETSNNETESNTGEKNSSDIDLVFDYWRTARAEAMGKTGGPPMRKTQARISKINARLTEGYSVEQLQEAIDGCLGNDYNVEGGFTDIELICRNQPKVEQYRTWHRKNKKSPAGGSSFYEEFVA